ncbi:MAG: UDP-4-amino-4,6-dideoxy-N-acetyl-beta-L-altrosamine transaminase [Pseudohongiellaceae bacterium]|nr:UDP-4-amino-4,6-dideoxy-N-acetyl-beta-L-altrosamine transaminase [Pseudohongiellaceae bacterium]
MIPYGRHDVSQDDIDAVVEVLKSDFLTQGGKVPEFESAVARKVGAEYAVAVNSATSALHISCLALGLSDGDWLWTTPITFVASANCGLYCGAQIDFVDIDPLTYNMNPTALAAKLKQAERDGRLPKIVVVVHLCGQPCEMVKIAQLSEQYGFRVIEDASHAIGGKYLSGYVGSCNYSDITVFSFHPVKIITTGEGGMALTNNATLASRMDLLRSHGITRDAALMKDEPHGPWYYEQIDIGFNYRMTDIQAALGLSQLDRLDRFVARRHELAKRYSEMLSGLPIKLPWQHPDTYSALHLYVIRLELDKIGHSHRQIFESLRARGIAVNLHYIPVYKQPWYQQLGYLDVDFPESANYYREAISLPIYPSMTDELQDIVVTTLREVFTS